MTTEKGLSEAQDTHTRAALYEQLVALTDIVLDGCRCQIESLQHIREEAAHYNVVRGLYEQNRQKLIHVFSKLIPSEEIYVCL